MKKGVSSLIAWVLLIGFAVTLAVFVSRWTLQQAQKSTTGVEEMILGDIQCSDVAIQGVCEDGKVKITNRGTLSIIGFRKGTDDEFFGKGNELKPNDEISNNDPGIYTPIIEVDGKKVICTTQKQKFECISVVSGFTIGEG